MQVTFKRGIVYDRRDMRAGDSADVKPEALAATWIAAGICEAGSPKRGPGRPKGSKNKPKPAAPEGEAEA